jgi:dynactin 1
MRALLIQIYLENTAACLNHVKVLTNSKIVASADEEESSYFGQRLDSLVTQARSSKVIAGKVLRSLEDLKSSSLSPNEDSANSFHISEAATRQLSAYTRQIGEEMSLLLTEEGRTDPFTYNEVLSTMAQTTSKFFETSGSDVDSISTFNSRLRSIASQLESLISLSTDLAKTQEFERHQAPWIVRAKELKSTNTLSPDTEEEIRRLKASLQERSTALGIRDNTLEENSIKIELLESRIREANRRSTFVHDLEVKLEAAQKKEKELSAAIEAQLKESQVMKYERDTYKRQVEERPRSIAEGANLPLPQDHATVVAATKTIESLRLEITALQATIRFLQDDNQRMKLTDPDSTEHSINAWLNEPLISRKPREEQQRRQNVKGECHDILNSLLKMTKEAKLVELKGPTAAKDGKSSIWMPMKERSRWQTAKMREEWEDWRQWRDEVVKRETGWEGRIGNTAASRKLTGKASKAPEFGAEKVEIVT